MLYTPLAGQGLIYIWYKLVVSMLHVCHFFQTASISTIQYDAETQIEDTMSTLLLFSR